MEIYLDSGVRKGADVVKALALGARAVFVGRPVLWGLACDGKQGVDRVLRILREELEHTMRLLGCSGTKDLCKEFVINKNHHSRPFRSTL
ncbi:2-Hydroxyacid oxidase 1-like [Dermacentor silvarum]|uniref:2-Hydroxyacid oxidase 1-like n=1 Tax=Dermacentor silvarum TaxID=543639 RepID=UPI0021014708|nr:2-Hydroxyacid oxidase 1-like [Dermacentor silvarum]